MGIASNIGVLNILTNGRWLVYLKSVKRRDILVLYDLYNIIFIVNVENTDRQKVGKVRTRRLPPKKLTI